MKLFATLSLALGCMAGIPAVYGDDFPLVCMLQKGEETPAPAVSIKNRAAAFPALAALPADTDSFFAVSQLGCFSQLVGQVALVPGVELMDELDSLALGISRKAVEDMERLMPLIHILSDSNQELAENWLDKANDDAARAIVAQLRERDLLKGEEIVAATRNFHLSPVYLTLSCRPGGERLLHQLSVLPLMLPVDPDGPYEMTVRNGWKGFCLRGDKVDIASAGLAPEHEDELRQNMQDLRLYLLARVFGNKLVLVFCSDLADVKLPSRAENSVLSSAMMQDFDDCLQHKPYVLSYSSPAVVNLRESLNLQSYRSVAAFMSGIFRRLAPQGGQFHAAADAVDALLAQLCAVMPVKKVAEQMAIWKSDAVYIRMVSDACGQRFSSGNITGLAGSSSEDTIFYAESTPMHGTPEADLPAALNAVQKIQTGYQETLSPAAADREKNTLEKFVEMRPCMEKLATGVQRMADARAGHISFRLSETKSPTEPPAYMALRAQVQDSAAFQEGFRQCCDGVVALLPQASEICRQLQVETEEHEALVHNGNKNTLVSSAPVPVEGGAVFSLNVPVAARAMEQVDADSAAMLQAAASWIQRVDGCLKTADGQLYTYIRLQMND